MSPTQLLAACAFAFAAVGAHAVPTYTLSTPTDSNYGVGNAYVAVGSAGVATGSMAGMYSTPSNLTATSPFYYTAFTGSSLTLTAGGSNFSFLWGSPDLYNTVTFLTSQGSFASTGNDLAAQFGSGTIGRNAIVFNAALTGGTINSVVFTSSDAAFELAVAAPVPEPETYALLGAGLLALGFMARRARG